MLEECSRVGLNSITYVVDVCLQPTYWLLVVKKQGLFQQYMACFEQYTLDTN